MLIDVHTHVTPPRLPDCPSDKLVDRWPCLQCGTSQRGSLLLGAKPFRELDDRSWDPLRRIGDMDDAGIDVQVLSPMPELLSYWFEASATERLCDSLNDFIGSLVARNPHRFRGLGALPMQDPERAARQMVRLRSEFGLCGVEIGSNINGVPLGDQRLEPFYAAAEELGMPIFVHALHPLARNETMSPYYVSVALFPIEIAMAAASLIMAGVPERFPGLRIAFSHGGGGFSAMLGRLDQGWSCVPALSEKLRARPSEIARKLFFDSNVYDPAELHFLAVDAAPGRVFAGSDYPYKIMERDLASLIEAAGLDSQRNAEVRSLAALAFLGEGSEAR